MVHVQAAGGIAPPADDNALDHHQPLHQHQKSHFEAAPADETRAPRLPSQERTSPDAAPAASPTPPNAAKESPEPTSPTTVNAAARHANLLPFVKPSSYLRPVRPTTGDTMAEKPPAGPLDRDQAEGLVSLAAALHHVACR